MNGDTTKEMDEYLAKPKSKWTVLNFIMMVCVSDVNSVSKIQFYSFQMWAYMWCVLHGITQFLNFGKVYAIYTIFCILNYFAIKTISIKYITPLFLCWLIKSKSNRILFDFNWRIYASPSLIHIYTSY